VANGIGYATAFLIYITLFIYGAMVMRGVMEEKTNRIAEVIISSVRPFQLMMGKIIGIGAVGLTQFLIWIITCLAAFRRSFPGLFRRKCWSRRSKRAADSRLGAAKFGSPPQHCFGTSQLVVPSIGAWLFFALSFSFWAAIFFMPSLFAALGSAVNEDPQDAQSLMMPITMPIVLALLL
jgi:ABC-2 type transport system permease protein